MKRTVNPNINTKIYWNSVYGDQAKRAEYASQQTIIEPTIIGHMLIQPTTRFKKALEYIKNGNVVIDMGCGVGVFTKLVKETYPDCEVWGTDISDQAIKDNSQEHPDITYIHQYIGNQTKLPNEYFNVVFSGEVIEHLDDPKYLFNDAYRCLKSGGTLIVTTPLEENVRSEEHVWTFNKEDIKDLFVSAGFTSVGFVDLANGERSLVIFAVGIK